MEILKKDTNTNEVLEKLCFVNGDKIKYEFSNPEEISDGYHTFKELYEHRITLYVALCKLLKRQENAVGHIPVGESFVWRSKKHSDDSEFEEWFILGIGKEKGKQMTYHLPISKWNECDFAETLENAPEWDKHTSEDVLKRLSEI